MNLALDNDVENIHNEHAYFVNLRKHGALLKDNINPINVAAKGCST